MSFLPFQLPTNNFYPARVRSGAPSHEDKLNYGSGQRPARGIQLSSRVNFGFSGLSLGQTLWKWSAEQLGRLTVNYIDHSKIFDRPQLHFMLARRHSVPETKAFEMPGFFTHSPWLWEICNGENGFGEK